jgi:hypothetical protein
MMKYILWVIMTAAMIVSLNGCAGNFHEHSGDGGNDIIDRTWGLGAPPPYGGAF